MALPAIAPIMTFLASPLARAGGLALSVGSSIHRIASDVSTSRSVNQMTKRAEQRIGEIMDKYDSQLDALSPESLQGPSRSGSSLPDFSGIGTFAKTGIAYNSVIENSETAWKRIMRSEEAGISMVEALRRKSLSMPFSFNDWEQAARSLAKAGYEGDSLVRTLDAAADAASGSGGGEKHFYEIAATLGQMKSSGAVSLEHLNRLAGTGIDGFDLLAGATGRTADEIKEMAQAGQLGESHLSQLVAQMEKVYAGSASEKSGNLQELFSTMDEIKVNTAAEIMRPLQELATPYLQSFVSGFSDAAGEVSSFFTDLIADNKDFIDECMGIVSVLFTELKEVWPSVKLLIEDFIVFAIPLVSSFFAFIGTHTPTIVQSINDFLSVVQLIANCVYITISQILEIAGPAIEEIGLFVVTLGTTIKNSWDCLLEMFDEVVKFIEDIPGKVEDILSRIQAFFGSFIRNIGGMLEGLWGKAVQGAKNWFANLMGNAMEGIKENLPSLPDLPNPSFPVSPKNFGLFGFSGNGDSSSGTDVYGSGGNSEIRQVAVNIHGMTISNQIDMEYFFNEMRNAMASA